MEHCAKMSASFSGLDSETMADFAARNVGNGGVWVENLEERRNLETMSLGFLQNHAIEEGVTV